MATLPPLSYETLHWTPSLDSQSSTVCFCARSWESLLTTPAAISVPSPRRGSLSSSPTERVTVPGAHLKSWMHWTISPNGPDDGGESFGHRVWQGVAIFLIRGVDTRINATPDGGGGGI
ncbi:hypothetical protein [Mycobacterium sp. DL440]|uniref:hypothetical protein n=1 Tax=Mycobacterium sp. DL440 TaxID=2675523 RepID=UPI001424921A|nr:hypothetical protein [Mycobacterium sp. DL440]